MAIIVLYNYFTLTHSPYQEFSTTYCGFIMHLTFVVVCFNNFVLWNIKTIGNWNVLFIHIWKLILRSPIFYFIFFMHGQNRKYWQTKVLMQYHYACKKSKFKQLIEYQNYCALEEDMLFWCLSNNSLSILSIQSQMMIQSGYSSQILAPIWGQIKPPEGPNLAHMSHFRHPCTISYARGAKICFYKIYTSWWYFIW